MSQVTRFFKQVQYVEQHWKYIARRNHSIHTNPECQKEWLSTKIWGENENFLCNSLTSLPNEYRHHHDGDYTSSLKKRVQLDCNRGSREVKICNPCPSNVCQYWARNLVGITGIPRMNYVLNEGVFMDLAIVHDNDWVGPREGFYVVEKMPNE